MLGMPVASVSVAHNGSVSVADSMTSTPARAASATPAVNRGMKPRAIRAIRATAIGPLADRDISRPSAEANSARGSTGSGWNPSPCTVTAPAKSACVATTTSCPASRSRTPSPVYGATSPQDPAVTISTRTRPPSHAGAV